MKATEGTVGRVFVLRLEDNDLIPDCIEQFAIEKNVMTVYVLLIGGMGAGSVVAGPRDFVAMPPDLGVGLIAPDDGGTPRLHVHGALGRAGNTLTGCLRNGVRTWFMAEAVLCEIVAGSVRRQPDARSGLSLLNFD